ncbi:hypothetical protein BRDID11002_52140 [Bradyrhizobium diazoefficiens]
MHLTLDMAGQARFGPDVEWIETINYEVDPSRAERFYPAIRRYWPTLPDGALMPSYSGIRPKIVPPAVATQDFLMQGPRDHGVAGLINLFGIESPGLTSLARDRRSRRRARKYLKRLQAKRIPLRAKKKTRPNKKPELFPFRFRRNGNSSGRRANVLARLRIFQQG